MVSDSFYLFLFKFVSLISCILVNCNSPSKKKKSERKEFLLDRLDIDIICYSSSYFFLYTKYSDLRILKWHWIFMRLNMRIS